jgi:hypothetical protein
LDPADGDDGG